MQSSSIASDSIDDFLREDALALADLPKQADSSTVTAAFDNIIDNVQQAGAEVKDAAMKAGLLEAAKEVLAHHRKQYEEDQVLELAKQNHWDSLVGALLGKNPQAKTLVMEALLAFVSYSVVSLWNWWRKRASPDALSVPALQQEQQPEGTQVVRIGRAPINGFLGVALPVLLHTAIQVGDLWYELTGEGGKDSGLRNAVKVTRGGSRTRFRDVTTVGYVYDGQQRMRSIAKRWLRSHPRYDLGDANCQAFVIYALRQLGLKVPFQNQGELFGEEGRKVLKGEALKAANAVVKLLMGEA